jgi:hypothetical protein
MAGGCSLGNTMGDIEKNVFQSQKCLLCHGKLSLFPTTFDVMSPNLADRVVDKAAEARPDKGKCAGKVLVPRGNPLGGILVEKVEQAKPSCGDRMPQAMMPLTADEIACVKAWAMMAVQAAR